ncbi:unnamed protein product [Sphagnum jensenii]|uniref:Uncharacterized protein n=1 Tax=Sphagnum jensenii TaxID=128206 RepID=A0ABP0VCC9_9BRYO
MVAEVFSAPFRPKVVEDECAKNVEQLPWAEALDEGDHVRSARGVSSIDVASFGGVPVEGDVSEWWGGLPMPLPGVPGEVLDKARFEDPESWCFLTCGFQFLGDFESRPEAFLGEDFDRTEVASGDGDGLVGGGLNVPVRRHSSEFDRLGLSRGCVEDEIYPFEGGAV